MVEFKNRDDVVVWLDGQSKQVCTIIAARAALRSTPYLNSILRTNLAVIDAAKDIVLPQLWATASALSEGRWPDKAAHVAAAAAHVAADASDAAESAAVAVSAYAAAAAAYAADSAAADAAADAAAYAAYAADSAAAAAVYRSISNDANHIRNGTKPEDLAIKRLWEEGEELPLALSEWAKLSKALRGLNQDWDVWIKWYEDRLAGKPMIETLELARISFPPEDYKNPAVLNAKIKALEIEHLAKATPLAETLALKPDGKVDVEFLPVAQLYAQNLDRLKDAISGCVGRNIFNASSDEVFIVTDMLDNHFDNPQRIYDECDFMRGHIKDMISKGYIDENLQTKRLVSALDLSARDILGNEPKVKDTVAARNALNSASSATKLRSGDMDINVQLDLIKEILSKRLNIEMVKDGDALTKAFIGGDKSNLVYRLVSRLTRMYLIIQRDSHLANISDSAKLSLLHSLPYIEAMIATLRQFFGI